MKPVNLTKHPEGGSFLEVFRSEKLVTNSNGTSRSALTHIYFSLQHGEVSRFHKVASDEVWNLYQGEGIYLYTWDGRGKVVVRTELSSVENRFCHVVPAGFWQAAEPVSGDVLVGCSVAPGFEFADFTLIKSGTDDALRISSIAPDLSRLI